MKIIAQQKLENYVQYLIIADGFSLNYFLVLIYEQNKKTGKKQRVINKLCSILTGITSFFSSVFSWFGKMISPQYLATA